MKNVEITCEVFDDLEKIKSVLSDLGFKYVETFVLDDVYMYNKDSKEFFVKDGKISDTLIIRNVDDKDKVMICKKREYNCDGVEISTNKTDLKVEDSRACEKFLNSLGYERYLQMIDVNYMYENDKCTLYVQVINGLGTFLELESKLDGNAEKLFYDLIEYVKGFGLNIGAKFDIRKAEMLYNLTSRN